MSLIMQIAVAVAAGLAFSVMGVMFRVGQTRNVPPIPLFSMVGMVGTIFFVGKMLLGNGVSAISLTEIINAAPWFVWVAGLAAGLGNYGAVALMKPILDRGPFSPMWCAFNLMFVPAAIYAFGFLHERLTAWQVAGLVTSLLCVVVSSQTVEGADSPAPGCPRHGGNRLIYALLLLAVIAFLGIHGIALKDFTFRPDASGSTILERFGALYFALVYAGITCGCAIDILLQRNRACNWKAATMLGFMTGLTSVTGMLLMARSAGLPGGVSFAIICVVTILGASLVSAFAFHEDRSRGWYATLALAVISVILFNLG